MRGRQYEEPMRHLGTYTALSASNAWSSRRLGGGRVVRAAERYSSQTSTRPGSIRPEYPAAGAPLRRQAGGTEMARDTSASLITDRSNALVRPRGRRRASR